MKFARRERRRKEKALWKKWRRACVVEATT